MLFILYLDKKLNGNEVFPQTFNYSLKLNDTPKMVHRSTTALFDSNIDNNDGAIFKEEGLVEIIEDYNAQYGQDFTIPTFAKMKKDIAARLAHKKPYERIAVERYSENGASFNRSKTDFSRNRSLQYPQK